MTKHENMEPMLDLDSLPVEKTGKAARFSLDKGMDDLVGAICDPTIVFQSAWATKDFFPEWLMQRITMDRLIELMVARKEEREPMATDSEALAYMMPRTMEAPLGHDWTQVYLYLGTKVIDTETCKGNMPDDIRVDKLDSGQEADLRHLKQWIFNVKVKHRAGRRKEMKQEIKEEEETEKAAQEVIQHAFKLD